MISSMSEDLITNDRWRQVVPSALEGYVSWRLQAPDFDWKEAIPSVRRELELFGDAAVTGELVAEFVSFLKKLTANPKMLWVGGVRVRREVHERIISHIRALGYETEANRYEREFDLDCVAQSGFDCPVKQLFV